MTEQKKVRMSHDYTSELELKSLLIRLQNWNLIKAGIQGHTLNKHQKLNNAKINRYIKLFIKVNTCDQTYPRLTQFKKSLKERVVRLSTLTPIDRDSYENFGSILVLMIKKILTKHSFSGYSYKEDFYSDSIHKVLKYGHNFNFALISVRSGQEVSAFAYISQIIHNSIVYIIKQKAKEQENIKDVISLEIIYGDLDLKAVHKKGDMPQQSQIEELETVKIKVETLEGTSLAQIIENIHADIELNEDLSKTKFKVEYPKDYRITFEEFDSLRPLLKGNIDIIRATA